MILRMLLRQRIVLTLIIVIPATFLLIVELTTSERMIPFKLASLNEEVFVEMSEKGISFIFFAVASAGFLVSDYLWVSFLRIINIDSSFPLIYDFFDCHLCWFTHQCFLFNSASSNIHF
jgi:hypothetical protein